MCVQQLVKQCTCIADGFIIDSQSQIRTVSNVLA